MEDKIKELLLEGEVFFYSEHESTATATITKDEEVIDWWEDEVTSEEEKEDFLASIIEDLTFTIPEDTKTFIENF